VETPTNPLMRVIDLGPIAYVAEEEGLALLVDATFARPFNFRAIEHGADVVITSATKYLNGHSDVIGGAVAGSGSFVEEVNRLMRLWGQAIDPHAAWLIDRGMRTLAVRMERHNANGLAVAQWAEKQDGITKVHYPGLPSHPDHERAKAVLHGFGGMVGLELKGGVKATERLLQRLTMIAHAPSLAGVETLVSEPRLTSHKSIGAEGRAKIGIPDGFLRLSCGIEDAEDIIGDLEQALGK
jgi:cystathionine beta-lyase/cystathionine gamma-synthase